MNESMISISKRKRHHICGQDYAVHVLVSNVICLFCGLSMTIPISESQIQNGQEGIFSDIKTKLRVHSGLGKGNRKKLIDEYLTRHY